MSITTSTNWDVRTLGNDTNGGGFDPFITNHGTDMSAFDNKNSAGGTNCQSTTANLSTVDAVANGSTTITSATAAFTAALIGNVIYFAGGTGAIAASPRIVTAVASATSITIDASIAASTGMTMNIGGGLLAIATAVTRAVETNTIWVKAGTYTFTAVIAFAAKGLAFIGYTAAHGDRSTRPLITTSTDSTNLFQTNGGFTHYWSFVNLSMSNTASVRAMGIISGQGTISVVNCLFDGFSNAIGLGSSLEGLSVYGTEVKNCTGLGITLQNADAHTDITLSDCYIHDCGGGGVLAASQGGIVCIRSLIVNNTGKGLENRNTASEFTVINSTIANNTGDGIYANSNDRMRMEFTNNIIYGNGGIGINHSLVGNGTGYIPPLLISNNAFGSNTGGNVQSQLTTGASPVTLTANPFTNTSGANRDYTLNSAAGGGALCKGAAWAGAVAGSTLDLGAVQAGGTGGGQRAYPV